MVGIRSFPFGMADFQVLCQFQGGYISSSSPIPLGVIGSGIPVQVLSALSLMVAGGSHFMLVEDPKLFAQNVLSFIQ